MYAALAGILYQLNHHGCPELRHHQGTVIHKSFQSLNFSKPEKSVGSFWISGEGTSPPHIIKLETPFYLPDFPSSQRHMGLSEIFPHKNTSWDMALSSFSPRAFLSSLCLSFVPSHLFIFIVKQSGRATFTTKLSPEAGAVWVCHPRTLVAVWLRAVGRAGPQLWSFILGANHHTPSTLGARSL